MSVARHGEVAKLAGISAKQMAHIETGKRPGVQTVTRAKCGTRPFRAMLPTLPAIGADSDDVVNAIRRSRHKRGSFAQAVSTGTTVVIYLRASSKGVPQQVR